MNLTPSPEQAQFAAALHDLLTESPVGVGPNRVGSERAGVWARLAGVGVTGLLVPERWGGSGGDPSDLVVAAEELGHHAVPGPLAESVAAVPALLRAIGGGAADEWLPELAAGRLIATLAAPPWLPLAADADLAGLVLHVTPASVRLARPGSCHPSMDASRQLFEVSPGELVATGVPAAHALDLGVLTCSAQLLGAARALLEASIRHAVNRVQFGHPIGTFQAVQHLLADVAVAIEFARPLLHAAAVSLTPPATTAAGDGPASGAAAGRAGVDVCPPRDVSAAKVACGDAAVLAARTALQIHGAIGYTEEHGLGRWLTKVRVLALAWGTPSQHRARIMTELARHR
ncbi:acyl-CoA dehydrogenase family protein [Actinoplanes sp. NPDC051851]|uniref:acyl-CoA dehydrogenase family protein n=1 Tax=Actinoplanes sp. NPDC051851 TaxID=3154753 RepID=UPI0034363720